MKKYFCVAICFVVILSATGCSFEGETTKTQTVHDRVVYITPTGKKFHYSADCAGNNAMVRMYSEIKYNYAPCKTCAK